MKTVAIVQARMQSTRLPKKVMRPILDVPMIERLLLRLAKAKRIDKIVVAVSVDPSDDPLAEHVRAVGYEVFRGSYADVLGRYYEAAKAHGADVVVRITGDCPLIDPELVDEVILKREEENADYASNCGLSPYPDGLDTEVFSFRLLEEAALRATTSAEREHVTPYMREANRFRTTALAPEQDYSQERWTVDESVDFEVVEAVFRHFHPRNEFSWHEIIALRHAEPAIFSANRHIPRNEGAATGTGQKLWKRAKQIIPGGGMLLSKRAELFLPDRWPAYFKKAKGCRVWDLDGNEYIDMSYMGVGTNILGYGDDEVDEAVRKTISDGNMSTLNCPEEVYLAEALIELHPWAEMARFARSGGEANAVAIRIARAAAGKNKVAFCGYHGWHDWYLAANLGDETTLAGHLLPGLAPNGVPQCMRGTVMPFSYNNYSELEAIVAAGDVGVIVMEVVRNHPPAGDFLQKVRRLATDRGIVLIFDECTSGFRQNLGGIHKLFGVDPDIATFGKALGNGYAITAIIGRRNVMEAAQTTFISSTFWTERIGPTAALKTLEVMARVRSWEQITNTGEQFIAGWKALAEKYALSISVTGLPALASFSFKSPRALEYKTLITQEMLERGYLAGTAAYASIAHTSELVAGYFEALDPVFAQVKQCEDGRDIAQLLRGPVCHSGFARLN